MSLTVRRQIIRDIWLLNADGGQGGRRALIISLLYQCGDLQQGRKLPITSGVRDQ
jgi:hypothetical protein